MGHLNGIALKDHLRETHLFQQRLVVAMVVGGLLILGLVARLFWLQIVQQDHYATLSENNRVNVVPIPPTRGIAIASGNAASRGSPCASGSATKR